MAKKHRTKGNSRGHSHLTPAQICEMAKKTIKDEFVVKSSHITTWSTYAHLAILGLRRQYNYGKIRIQRYIDLQAEYYNKFIHDDTQWVLQKQRIIDFQKEKQFEIFDDVTFDQPYVRAGVKEKSFEYKIAERYLTINNTYNDQSFRYWLSHYNALIDMGFSKTQLYSNFEIMNIILTEYRNGTLNTICHIHQLLIDEIGVDVAFPTYEEMINAANC